MSTPSNYPLGIYRGDSYQWVFRFWLDRNKTQPADLTGYTVHATIRSGTADVLIPCDLTPPNEVTMTLDGPLSAGLAVGWGQWDLELTDAAGWVQTPLAGAVSIRADVTLPAVTE